MGGAMTGNENLGAVSIDLAHVIRDIARDEIRVELQRQLGGLTDGERRILDMWPRFEDGEPVMPYDRVQLEDGDVETLYQVHVGRGGYSLYTETHDEEHPHGHLLKRPARSVLDADGVEIKVGDTVWFRSFSTGNRMCRATVTGFGERNLDVRLATMEDEAGRTWNIDPKRITHTPPDSWERLEEDAGDNPFTYCKAAGIHLYTFDNSERAKSRDIIRRAKALAGVEVDK